MTKTQPRADNLLMLMEWIRLGNKFYIHREFLLYLDIEDIVKACLVSKHYKRKYLKYSCFHFIGTNSHVLDHLRMRFKLQNHSDEMLLTVHEFKFYHVYCKYEQQQRRQQKILTHLKNMYLCNDHMRTVIGSILNRDTSI